MTWRALSNCPYPYPPLPARTPLLPAFFSPFFLMMNDEPTARAGHKTQPSFFKLSSRFTVNLDLVESQFRNT